MLSDSEHIDARTLGRFLESPSSLQVLQESAEPPQSTSHAQAMVAFERSFLRDALLATAGNVTLAAQRIGMGRATLYKKIATLGIAV